MKEELIHFVWKFGFFQHFSIRGIESSNFQIISKGTTNNDAGPDFIGAQIKSGEMTWIGNVEIHLKSSDWYRHGHHKDKAYNNVILQVVIEDDKEIKTENGRNVPIMEITIDDAIDLKYEEFKNSKKWISCENDIQNIEDFKIKMWLGNILVQRLTEKSQYIRHIYENAKQSWEETFYQLLSRNFGFKVNAEPFEWLAKSLPLKYLAKHQNSILQVEALLFGQAGFLSTDDVKDEYYEKLKKEYGFLKSKFNIVPIDTHLWKFMRLRPANFPTIRISQFAALIHQSKSLFSKILHAEKLDEIRNFFDIEVSAFWNTHYTFNKKSNLRKKPFGEESVNNILINSIIPILFEYGNHTNNDEIKEKALNFLEQIKPESNHLINGWTKIGIKSQNAFDTQALLHQKSHYCDKVKCLECGIGIDIFKKYISNPI